MDGSVLTYSEILSISESLKGNSVTMGQILDEIRNNFSKIGDDGVWSGTSANEAKAEFNKLAAKFDDFSKVVNDAANYLATVVANYQAVDNKLNQ